MRLIVVLLDIDNTLIDFEASTGRVIVWNGGVYLWQYFVESLRKACQEAQLDIRFGIATFKNEKNHQGLKGDDLSATVLEDTTRGLPWVYPGCGLRKWFDKDLEFFTSGQCKISHAMDKVAAEYKEINKEDIFIIDDRKVEVCDIAIAKGYSALCVGEDLAMLTHDSRGHRIAKIFEAIFQKLQLPLPDIISQRAKEPEITLKESQASLLLSRYKMQLAFTQWIIDPSQLQAEGIMSLDEDDHLNQPS